MSTTPGDPTPERPGAVLVSAPAHIDALRFESSQDGLATLLAIAAGVYCIAGLTVLALATRPAALRYLSQ